MIRFIADSTCDLSDEILTKYNIGIAPLTINISGKEYKDRIDITPNEFYSMMESFEKNPTTSMPDPYEFVRLFEESKENGYKQVICICMSSGTSGSYQSAVIAKKEYISNNTDPIEIYVLDSKSMSHGSGYLILKSIELMKRGANFKEIIHFNEIYKTNVKHFLAVDDLNHLIRSGRLSNASAILGKLLKVKPIMSMRNGKGAIVAKERGRKRVLNHYIREYIKRVDERITSFIIIGYTSDITVATNLKRLFLAETNFTGEIFIMQMGVSVGTHVGLGAISMYFIEKDHLKTGLLKSELEKIIYNKDKLFEKLKNKKQ
ncbi:MAG: DegV family protein [Bacillota bacterium]|nr:DegV family protein [Bacillota bacterium]